jgi:uncharacterized protein YbjT (DUF2867 family)
MVSAAAARQRKDLARFKRAVMSPEPQLRQSREPTCILPYILPPRACALEAVLFSFPMFGSGATRLQPAYVEDVAEAIVRILWAPTTYRLYELAGPRVYAYEELLRTISASAGARPFLFSVWHLIGYASEVLPNLPITRNQVELMDQDNVPEPSTPGFETLQISPRALENVLSEYATDGEAKA